MSKYNLIKRAYSETDLALYVPDSFDNFPLYSKSESDVITTHDKRLPRRASKFRLFKEYVNNMVIANKTCHDKLEDS